MGRIMVRSTRSGEEPAERAASTRSRGTRDKSCTQCDKDDRCMLNGIKQDNAIAAEKRIGGTRGWREIEGSEQGARWPEQMQPRQRHDLRCDHQRQQQEKTQCPASLANQSWTKQQQRRTDHKCQQRAEKAVSSVFNVARMTAGLERRPAKAVRFNFAAGSNGSRNETHDGKQAEQKNNYQNNKLDSRYLIRILRHRIKEKPASRDAGRCPVAERLGNNQRALLPHDFAEFFLVRRVVLKGRSCVKFRTLMAERSG